VAHNKLRAVKDIVLAIETITHQWHV
jgi:hypothetical protein